MAGYRQITPWGRRSVWEAVMKYRQVGLTRRLRQRRYEFILAAIITVVALIALINSAAGLI